MSARLLVMLNIDLPPPAKRRRGLAGSIVSTAVSAALIGTAVGLTVYRLWRDRGKILPPQPVLQEQEQEQIPPPPPYEQGEWKSEKEPTSAVKPTPSTPRSRRPRAAHVSTSAKRSSVRRPRRHPPTSYHAASQPVLPPSRPEFDFTPDQEDDPELDQMDWIGDKLAQLIEEGKRALKSEVVVMSESKDDEVDDGSGAWEEETTVPVQTSSMKSLSRSSSRAKRRNTHIPVATPYSSSSPRKSAFDLSLPSSSSSMAPVPITPKQRGRSVDLPLGASFTEDGNAWESPELRESMERARARFLATRNRGV